jgi:hypothetical protein
MEKITCRQCHAEIDAVDNYCRECGLYQKAVERANLVENESAAPRLVSTRTSSRAFSRNPLLDNPWVILLLLFFALGPLALPMLWQGKAFSRRAKWILTILVVGYTLFCLWLLWFITVKWIFEPLQKLQF